jgi:hypothetical protein
MNKNMFKYHLKERELKFNNRKQGMYKILLDNFKKVYHPKTSDNFLK